MSNVATAGNNPHKSTGLAKRNYEPRARSLMGTLWITFDGIQLTRCERIVMMNGVVTYVRTDDDK